MSRILIVIALLFASAPVQVRAQDAQPPAMVSAVAPRLQTAAKSIVAAFEGKKKASEVFSPAFLAEVPENRLRALAAQLTSQYGPLQKLESIAPLEPGRATIGIRYERAIVRGPFRVDEKGLVSGLLLNDIEPVGDSAETISKDLRALPGNVSVLLAPLDTGAKPLLSIRGDEQFAVGSTFKLYVLLALARSIEAGERSWDDVLTINRKSYPSGQMQDWPNGAPVTVHTLATMMITISDNTATDILFHTLGRNRIEAELRASGHSKPARNLPMLSTLELFALKGSPPNMASYLAADEQGRRRILADFEDDVGGDPAKIAPPRFAAPYAIHTVEWFASAQDLRKVMAQFTALEDDTARRILAAAPGVPAPTRDKWRYMGYKGGSEPGVLNLTWLLQDKVGRWHILAMSWNNREAVVDHRAFERLSLRLLALAQK